MLIVWYGSLSIDATVCVWWSRQGKELALGSLKWRSGMLCVEHSSGTPWNGQVLSYLRREMKKRRVLPHSDGLGVVRAFL